MATGLKSKLKKLSKKGSFKHGRFSRANLTIFAIIFAGVGGYLVLASHAATLPPTVTGAPAISGTTQPGQVLTATTGTWNNSPTSYSYQWYDEGAPISGATNSTYTIQSSDIDHTIAVAVTATNSSGSSSPAGSPSTGVVVNACDIVDTTSAQAVSDVQNSANSGKTICLRAGTYTISSITASQSAMTTLQAYPGDTQPTISNAPGLRVNNIRIEGFHLGQGLDDQGSGTIKIVGNYYHDANPGGALWYASTSDTANGTVSELHNRMVNVLINDTSFNDGWGMYGCTKSGQHYIQNYNTFQTMNQHPLQLAGCASITAIGNEYLDAYDQYSDQHVDCAEIWGGAGATLLQDNRCTDIAAHPGRSNDFLLSGDSGPFTVINNLIANSPKQCLDDTPNGTYNGSMKNGVIKNNTVVGCTFGAIDMNGGSSTGNTVEFNIADGISGNGNCSQFTIEDYNNAPGAPHCPGTHDTSLTPNFTSTAPSDPNATYQTTNIDPTWGYQPARVGYDAHLPGGVQAAASAPTVSLSASPASITSGGSSTLTWSSTNATSCSASNGWSGTKSISGTQSVSPTTTTTYTLTCTGTGGSANHSATVTVNSSSPKTGDINQDGSVDIFDLSILLSNYNGTTASCDLNTDGAVNIFDLSILLSNYGT